MALLTAGTGERTTEARDMGPRYVFYFILLSLFFLHKKKKKKKIMHTMITSGEVNRYQLFPFLFGFPF